MSRDSAVRVMDLAGSAATLSEAAFVTKHGSLYLMRVASDGVLTPTPDIADRDVYRGTYKIPTLRQVFGGDLGAPEEMFVYCAGPSPNQVITVGRAPQNEVCIDDVSVSANHATIEVDELGRAYVNDRASRNGTTVASVKVIGPTEVPFGKSLTFGTVSLLLLPASQFMELAVMFFGSREIG